MNQRHDARSMTAMIATIFMICVPVWFLGGNLPPVRTIALGFVALTSAWVLLTSLVSRNPSGGNRVRQLPIALLASLPLVLGVAYAAGQAFPIDQTLLPTASSSVTRLRLCELILGVTAYLLFARLLTNSNTLNWFFGIATVTGVAVAAFGLAQHAGWNGKLYWFYELIYGGQPFGPFVNGNNAGGFLLMCFAAGNFFLASRVYRTSPTQDVNGIRSHRKRGLWKNVFVGSLAQLDNTRLYVCGALVIIAAGISTSLSRGALVALAISTLAGWLVLLTNKRLAIGLASLLLILGISIGLYTEGNSTALRPTSVSESLQSMTDVTKAASNRLGHWATAWRAIEDHWTTGSGLGTYSMVYPAYQESHLTKIFLHTENQYLETLAELGVFGLAVLLIAIGIFLALSLHLMRQADAVSRAVGTSGLMCLIGQMIAGGLDFGLFQPANTLLMAGMMAALIGRKTWLFHHQLDQPIAPRWSQLGSQIVLLTMTAAACWATYEYSAVDARVTASRFEARFQPTRDADRLDHRTRLAAYAASVRPDDAKTYETLANLDILRYRLEAGQELLAAAIETNQTVADNLDAEPTTDTGKRAIQSAIQIIRQARLAQRETADAASGTTSAPAVVDQIAADETVGSGDSDASPLLPADVLANENNNQPIKGNISRDAIADSDISADAPPELTLDDVWDSTQLSNLHRLAEAAKPFNPEMYARLTQSAPVKTHLASAFQHLLKAHELHPENPHTQLDLAYLSGLFSDSVSAATRIENAIAQRPYDSKVLYNAGLLSLQSGRVDHGCAYWNRCLKLTRKFDPLVIRFCRQELSVGQFLTQVLPADPELLLRLARNYFRAPEDFLLKKVILNHTDLLVAGSDLDPTDKLKWQGLAALESRQYPRAIELFTELLETEPDQVSIRVGLAKALLAEERYLDATEELKVCQLYADCPYGLVQRLLNVANRKQIRVLRDIQRAKQKLQPKKRKPKRK